MVWIMEMLGAEPAHLLFFSPKLLPIILLNLLQQKLLERGNFDIFEKIIKTAYSSPK